jgi:hypothetical protein
LALGHPARYFKGQVELISESAELMSPGTPRKECGSAEGAWLGVVKMNGFGDGGTLRDAVTL